MRKTKRYIANPALVKRVSMLAQEAMENVQARKEAKKQLTQTYSEGNLRQIAATPLSSLEVNPGRINNASPLTSTRRRHSLWPLASLPNHKASAGGRHGCQSAQWPRDSRSPTHMMTLTNIP